MHRQNTKVDVAVRVVVVVAAGDTRTARGAVERMAQVVASSGKRQAVLLRSTRVRVRGLAVCGRLAPPHPEVLI